jgi:hypothetical protein
MLVGFVISTLKWLLIAAIVLAAIGLLAGWRPGRTSERSSRSTPDL